MKEKEMITFERGEKMVAEALGLSAVLYVDLAGAGFTEEGFLLRIAQRLREAADAVEKEAKRREDAVW